MKKLPCILIVAALLAGCASDGSFDPDKFNAAVGAVNQGIDTYERARRIYHPATGNVPEWTEDREIETPQYPTLYHQGNVIPGPR